MCFIQLMSWDYQKIIQIGICQIEFSEKGPLHANLVHSAENYPVRSSPSNSLPSIVNTLHLIY